MALSATVIGALLGLGTQMYSNALRKLPYMRRMSFPFIIFSKIILLNPKSFCLIPEKIEQK